MPTKGSDIHRYVEIAEEAAFADTPEGDAEDSDVHYSEFIHFGRKYYAISLVNAAERKLKVGKGQVTVTYQIHRTGNPLALASTPLTESWADGIFYFAQGTYVS